MYEILDKRQRRKTQLANLIFIKNIDIDAKTEKLATKLKVKAEKNKMVNTQTFDSSFSIDQT